VLMPYLVARLIMSLPRDKSSDGGRAAEKKGCNSRILGTYHQRERKKVRREDETGETEFVIYGLSWGQGQIRSIPTIINPRPSFVTYISYYL